MLVVLADVVGRVVLPPTEVQVGIMTAVVGVPVFLVPGPARPDRGAVTTVTATLTSSPRDARTVRDRRTRRPPVASSAGHGGPARAGTGWSSAGSACVLLVLCFAARVLLGDFTVTLPDFFRILGGAEIPGASYILMESKLPRAVLGVLVGVAFGVGGAIFQTTLRNPLASPDIIGVSLGASAAAVFAIVLLDQRGLPVSVAAVVGAVGDRRLVRLVGRAGRRQPPGAGRRGRRARPCCRSIQYLFTRADE